MQVQNSNVSEQCTHLVMSAAQAAETYGLNSDKLFPKNQYKELSSTGESAKTYCVAFLMLYKPKYQQLSTRISKLLEADVNRPLTDHKITLLTLSCILGDKSSFDALLNNGAQCTKDYRGWTPLHHAAVLRRTPFLERLKSVFESAIPLKSKGEATADELAYLVRRPCCEQQKPVYLRDNDSERQLSAQEFKKMTGADLTQRLHSRISFLVDQWRARTFTEKKSSFFSMDKFTSKVSEAHKLLAFKRHAKVGLGVIARKTILADTHICDYGGVAMLTKDLGTDATYLYENIQGKGARGFGPTVNHGFPNVMFVDRHQTEIKQVGLVTLSDVQEGEMLCVDYGILYDGLLRAPFVELRKDALLNFFQEHPIKRLLEDRPATRLKSLIAAKYLASTPASTMHLIFEKRLTARDIKKTVGAPACC